jgi:hypothetical protein
MLKHILDEMVTGGALVTVQGVRVVKYEATEKPRQPHPIGLRLKTEEVYRRYAMVDQAMIREAAIKMNRRAKVRRTGAQRGGQSDLSMADR